MHDVLAALTLRIARPLIWHDRTAPLPKAIFGGTCFFLRFESGIVGVTANHVLEVYEKIRSESTSIACQLRTIPFDPIAALIDRDAERDIATFRASEGLLARIEAIALDCRMDWPPPEPDVMRGISLCGFPENMRTSSKDGTAEFGAWGALAAVEDLTEREILVTYDPERDTASRWAPTLPPLGLNLSGCSGGPVIMHGERNGLHRWFPVGIVIAGPRDSGSGASAQFDMVRVRRIHVVQPDGSIQKDDDGWLPRVGSQHPIGKLA